MSDNEGGEKKSGYRLEYANSNRAKCKGPKPCAGTTITKGELRVGSIVDFRGNTSFAWRHWGCTTAKIFENMKKSFEEADELDGFEDLNDDDQDKVRKAWEAGHVADEDIPDSARKADGDEDEDGDEAEDGEKPKKAAKGAAAKGGKKEPTKGVFKLEYAPSGRAKCKGECKDTIGKDFFRVGNEVDFRGHKSFHWQHWGCTPASIIAQLKQSYDEPDAIEGFNDLKDDDKERVRRAWEDGAIPEDDKGVGEAVDTGKKKKPAAARKRAADDDGEKPKKRARKVKDDDDDDMDDEEEKPKPKRGKAAAEKKPPARKRAPKKKAESEEEDDAEDFGDEIANVSGDDEEETEEEAPKKRKRAAKPSTSKAAVKPASKPASKRASKPTSSRGKKQAAEASDED